MGQSIILPLVGLRLAIYGDRNLQIQSLAMRLHSRAWRFLFSCGTIYLPFALYCALYQTLHLGHLRQALEYLSAVLFYSSSVLAKRGMKGAICIYQAACIEP